MDFDTSQIAWIAIAIFASSIVQGAIGFAVALVAVPLLLTAGLSLSESIFVVLFTAVIQNVIGIFKTWRSTEIRSLWLPGLVRILFIPVGFLLMQTFESLETQQLSQLFGMVLLTVLVLQKVIRVAPREKVDWRWTQTAMVTSGLAQGAIGTPGPPLAFWVMSHDWPTPRSRGTLFFLFITGTVPHCLLLAATAESGEMQRSLTIVLYGLPLAFMGSAIGLWLGDQFERERLRAVAFFTLLFLGIKLIFFS